MLLTQLMRFFDDDDLLEGVGFLCGAHIQGNLLLGVFVRLDEAQQYMHQLRDKESIHHPLRAKEMILPEESLQCPTPTRGLAVEIVDRFVSPARHHHCCLASAIHATM